MQKISFIGIGNMASAIINGMLREQMLQPGEIGGYDISEEIRAQFAGRGHVAFAGVEQLVRSSEVILLSVKPQVLPKILAQIKGVIAPQQLVVSIVAGVTGKAIQQALGFPCKVVQAMPNTALMVGKGATALSRIPPVTDEEFAQVHRIFSAAGIAEEIDADILSASIPVHASSPAFLYLFAKTIVDRAALHGIDRDAANRLFCQTLIGCANMMLESGKSHQELIDMVCSPGGTTLAALDAMQSAGFTESVQAGFDACIRRAQELAAQQETAQ